MVMLISVPLNFTSYSTYIGPGPAAKHQMETEIDGQPANPGSPQKYPLKWCIVCICVTWYGDGVGEDNSSIFSQI